MGVAAGGRVGVQRPVEQADSLDDDRGKGFLILQRAVEPACRLLLGVKGRERSHRRHPGERQLRGFDARLNGAGTASAARGRRRRSQRLKNEHALGAVGFTLPHQVTAVIDGEGAGELELRESEELN